MQRIITAHIQNVAGHYKSQCYAWDVVNEAFEDDGKFRQSPSMLRPFYSFGTTLCIAVACQG